MVYFICQGCQESFKKPAVRKHLTMRCRGAAMACVDCNQVFYGDEWEKHTSCVSEEKKYQGSLYNEKEGEKGKKGQMKQDAWTEGVAKCVELCVGANANLKYYVEKLSGFDNVPRKQKPFVNFLKNSFRLYDNSTAERIWELLSEAQRQNSGAGAAVCTECAPSLLPPPTKRWMGWGDEITALVKIAGEEGVEYAEVQKLLCGRYEEQAKKGIVKKRTRSELEDLALASVPDTLACDSTKRIRMA